MTVRLGDIVIYKLSAEDNFYNNNAVEAPAVVVRIFDQHYVNLKVITDGQTDVWKTSIRHISTYDEVSRKSAGYWRFIDES